FGVDFFFVLVFLSVILRLPISTLFPYTTLFRSLFSPISLSLSFGLFRPYSVSLFLSASISLAEIVPSLCQFSKSDSKFSIKELSVWSLIGVSRRHLLSPRRISIFSSPF